MRIHVKALLLPMVIGLLFMSCASTNELTIPVTQPATVFLPASIQKVGLVDRSLPSEKNRTADEIDKILSIEGKNLDKEAAGHALMSLTEELKVTERFESVQYLENVPLRSPGLGVHPAALPWEKVNEICETHGIDALFTLSFFDTDTKVDYTTVPVTIKGPLGVEIPTVEHRAQVSTLIKTGWRIYDPQQKLIRDECIEFNTANSSGAGINPVKAIEAIVNRKELVLKISQDLGQRYASRIFPYHTRVRRDYFVRGTDNFKKGMRLARTGYWQRAAELWEAEVGNSNDKVAGRACYNMAIINEINGNLDEAVEWASRSYSEYRIRRGLDYVRTLEYRIRSEQALQYQMEEQSKKISGLIEDE
ncbi:MAG: hypothetical protein HKN89_03610 [Eudoraea sp.]|nr:hypothetical protein [Eudoraea sp.]